MALSPLDNNDLLAEILLRLPPRPSSLPRASLVCKRWRSLVSDPAFLRGYRARHRNNPPLLGFFSHDADWNVVFTPALEPPDRIPAERFFLQHNDDGAAVPSSRVFSCRHGRVLVLAGEPPQFLVWDPVSGDKQRVDMPVVSSGQTCILDGIVMGGNGHVVQVQGAACHSTPFQVVFLYHSGDKLVAAVYSSETRGWGNLVSVRSPRPFRESSFCCCHTKIRNCIYWLLNQNLRIAILEFDLDRQALAFIDLPPEVVTFDVRVSEIMSTPASLG